MKLTAAALCACTLVPTLALATLYQPGVEAGFSSSNGISGSFLFGESEFSSRMSWQGNASWDGNSSERSAMVADTSTSVPDTTGAIPPYNAIGRTQAASAYAQPNAGRLGASVSNYVNFYSRNELNPMSGYATVKAWGEIADDIIVTGAAPVEVTLRMRMHGTQGFTDQDAVYQTASASMHGAIGVMGAGYYVGDEKSVRFDDMNAGGASVDQMLSYTTLLQPGSTLVHARFEAWAEVTVNSALPFDPGAFSNGANTGTVWITVAETDLPRISSQNGLLLVAVPEPTMLTGAAVIGMVMLKRPRKPLSM